MYHHKFRSLAMLAALMLLITSLGQVSRTQAQGTSRTFPLFSFVNPGNSMFSNGSCIAPSVRERFASGKLGMAVVVTQIDPINIGRREVFLAFNDWETRHSSLTFGTASGGRLLTSLVEFFSHTEIQSRSTERHNGNSWRASARVS